MRQISYTTSRLLVADAVCDALLDLVTAIDREERSDLITFPALNEQQQPCRVQMTVHARSELVVTSLDHRPADDENTPDVIDAVADIRARIATHSQRVPHPMTDEPTDEPYAFHHGEN